MFRDRFRHSISTRLGQLALLLLMLPLSRGLFAAQPSATATPPATSATNATWANVTGIVPKPGEPIQNRLVVIFDKTIAWPKTANGTTSPALTFDTPQSASGFFEYGPNFFTYTGNYRFMPRRFIKATLNPALRSTDGHPVNPAQRVLPIVSTTFRPNNPWIIEQDPNHLILGIEFTYPVTLVQLRAHAAATDRTGKAFPCDVQPGTGAYNLRLEFNQLKGIAWPLTVRITAGLTEKEGLLHLENNYTFDLGRPEEKTISISSANWGTINETTQTIRINFTGRINPAQAARFISITDISRIPPRELPHTVYGDTTSDRACIVAFSVPNPYNMKIRVDVGPGVVSLQGEPLRGHFTRNLALREELRIENIQTIAQGEKEPYLRVQINQNVETADFIKHLSITPRLEGMSIAQGGMKDFSIHGNLQLNTKYTVTLAPGIKFNGWATQKTPVTAAATTPKRFPATMALAFAGKYYFPRTPNPALPLKTRNVGTIEVRLHRMFPNNIALGPAEIPEASGYSYYAQRFISRWCEEVARKRIEITSATGKLVTTPIKLAELMPPGQTGIFVLEIQNVDPPTSETGDEESDSPRRYRRYYYSGDSNEHISRFILMTNVGVLSHWTDKELTLFAHDLYTLAPVQGAHVRVFTSKNQQCGDGYTDERGIVQLKNFLSNLGSPAIALIEKGADATFLELSARGERGEDIPDTSAMLPYDRERYDAYLYADRALYRPGETVHLRWIGRKNYGDALTSVPLTLRIRKPTGDKLLEQPTVLSEWGTGQLDVATLKIHPTGTYEVELAVPGEETPLATYTFQLEEFVPNRLKATVEIPEPRWIGVDTTHSFAVVGRHLFGTPAENRTAEARVFFERGWQPAAWRGYRFDNDAVFELENVALGEQVTGKDGKAPYVFAWNAPKQLASPLKATVVGVVYEVGGRKVYGRASTMLFPDAICLGVRGAPGKKDGDIIIKAVAVKPDETVAALDKVEITLEKQIWNYTVRDYTTYQEPRWTGQYQPIETRQVALKNGQGEVTFSAPDYGYYRVRVHSPATRMNSTLMFYSFGGACRVTEGVEQKLVRLTLAKPLYRVGETAELRVEAPFDGTACIVIQGETIRRVMTIDVRKGAGTARFIVQPEDFPNTWLETTVIHAIDKKRAQVYPFASFAMTSLKVEDPERHIVIAIPNLPKEIKPARPLALAIETRDTAGQPVAAEVTLAAVDEGIHSIKGYTNPDPYSHFSALRRPDYRRAFYYDKVAYDFGEPTPGGDGDLAASLGRPKTNWIKTVALWSGPVTTGVDGKATVTLNIPEFTGELRIVAVAAGKRAIGAFAGSLLVRRPWMLETSMPRFLLPGDKATCRATVYNLTEKPCQAAISWTHEGALSGGEGRREVTIAGNSEANIQAEFAAGAAVGQGKILWRVTITDPATRGALESLSEDDPIPVAEPAAYQRREELRVLKPGQETTVTNTLFLDDELTRIAVTVGAQSQLRLQKALNNVVEYPYGCVEQTTSKLLPLYLLRKSQVLVQAALKNPKDIDDTIRAGIDRLFSMQTAVGGLSFWPGYNMPYPYGSIYALHALTLIKNGHEYTLPEQDFELLQNYVRKIADEGAYGGFSSLYCRAYAIYVLALGGDKEALSKIESFDAVNLPRPARYLLAAALARSTRDTDRVKMYLASTPSQPWTVRELDGTLSSDARNTAVELMSLTEMKAPRNQTEPLALKLTRYLETTRYGTTQEFAFVTAALCDYLDSVTTDIQHASAVIVQDGKEKRIAGREFFSGERRGPGTRFTIRNTGQTDIFVNVTSRGVPAQANSTEEKQGMAVRRHFYTRAGEPLTTATTFRQGESYVVEIELYTELDARNVVVADLLPAGLEVENPRLTKDEQGQGKLPYPSEPPSHLEIRDERVVLVYDRLEACTTDQPQDNHHFFYVVNAVTPGQFTYPTISAECMYDPAVHGISKSWPTKVEAGR